MTLFTLNRSTRFATPFATPFATLFATPFATLFATLFAILACSFARADSPFDRARLEREFRTPPREFTLLPFWFWNDELSDDELARQIAEFEARGVYGFTIHPRVGLPEDCGWMSPKLLSHMRFALEEARRRGMFVMLYDDGMYPSGSAAGQVVAENPAFAARGFVKFLLNADGKPIERTTRKTPSGAPETVETPVEVGDDWNFVGNYARPNGERYAVYDAPSNGTIRGLHYVGDESAKNPRETAPPAADLLNPDAVDAFVRLVYQRYYDEFESFFADGTVVGIFTDEPSILGRGPRRDCREGNLRALPTINRYLGFDFKPFLLDLWFDDYPETAARRAQYKKAVAATLEATYYRRISDWCVRHKTKLAGHPANSSDVDALRPFQIPGQDVVWRYIEPGEKAFDPTHSAMAKGASSVAIHTGARRNLNEVFGAYGHNFTYDEMVWLVGWCFARGHNMLLPHAFYYSVRGPRLDERPRDVGPNSPWWDDYRTFADYCSRLCWLNTDSTLIAPTAILVDSDFATTLGTRALFEHQLDFNYLDFGTLEKDARIGATGVVEVGSARYETLISTRDSTVPESTRPILERLAAQGRVVRLTDAAPEIAGAVLAKDDADLIGIVREKSGADVETPTPTPGLRARRIVKGDVDFYLLFNEGATPIETSATFAKKGVQTTWNPKTGEITPRDANAPIKLAPSEITIIAVE